MVKRIAIVGPESTGKSELAQHLAVRHQDEWVPEYARFYLDRLGREYGEKDLLEIAKGQVAWEDDKAQYARQWLFCDTNLIVIKIWSDFKYGRTDEWIEDELNRRQYHYYLLTDIDLPWLPDPQREHPERRTELFEIYRQFLVLRHLPFSVVSGKEENRINSAVNALNAT